MKRPLKPPLKRLIGLAAIGVTACTSGTAIRVSDADARIYVNGEYVGTGNGYYSDRKPAFTKQEVTLRKEGCADETFTFRRNERPALGAIISAYYLYLPILWFTRYKDHRVYEFQCEPRPDDATGIVDAAGIGREGSVADAAGIADAVGIADAAGIADPAGNADETE